MKKLYKFSQDWTYGKIEGIFIADSDQVKSIIGKEIYFGEVLGKYSECSSTLEKKDFKIISSDPKVIKFFEEKIEKKLECFGYNPLDYISEDENE